MFPLGDSPLETSGTLTYYRNESIDFLALLIQVLKKRSRDENMSNKSTITTARRE
jgi:hypothetical protein